MHPSICIVFFCVYIEAMYRPMPDVTEETWKERIAVRSKGVALTKEGKIYKAAPIRLRPPTPDPNIRIPKRCWERQMTTWRQDLRAIRPEIGECSTPLCWLGGNEE